MDQIILTLKNKLILLLAGKIGKAVTTVASGAVLGQLITVLLMPVVTRLYSPEAMGIQSVFISVGNILATSAALTYPLALILPKKESDAAYLIILSILFGFVTSLGVFIFILIADAYLAIVLSELGNWVYLLPPYVFFSVLGVVSAQYLIREKRFKAIARISWELSAVVNLSKVIGGMLFAVPLTLIVVNILGGLVRLLLSMRFIVDRLGAYFQNVSVRGCKGRLIGVAKTHKDFPFYRAPQAIIAALSQSLPLIIISALFDASVVGQFALALTVLSLPANFLGAAVSQVVYPVINDAIRAGNEITSDIIRITVTMGLIGAPVFAVFAIAGDYVFNLVFGETWILAGKFSQWLALFMFIDFLSRPSVAIIPVLGLQRGLLAYEISFFIIKSAVLFTAFHVALSPILFVSIYSIVCAVVCSLLIFWAIRSSHSNDRRFR